MPPWLNTQGSQATAATLLLAAAFVLPMLPIRASIWLQVTFRVIFLALLTVVVRKLLGSPFDPHFNAAQPSFDVWQRLIEAGWWFAAARAAVGVGRLFVVLENRPRETQIVSDLVAGAVYVATILAVVNFSIEVPIRGLLATSGVIAIVLGLALQSTLSDVFSGIAVGLERPYKPGDLLWVEGGIEGRVVQLNWRSTQIATAQDNIATIPNSIMAKSRMINRSAPTLMRADTVSISLDPAAVPEHCQTTLEAAVRACRIPLSSPAPSVHCSALRGDGAVYDIEFSIESSSQLGAARAEIFDRAHRHLRYAGIALAVTGLASVPRITVPTPQQVLAESDLFGVMEAEARNLLADHFSARWLEPGDRLISEGAAPLSLFIVVSGTASVTKAGVPQLLHLVSPGETMGAIGLITGAPYAVTVTALTRVRVFELGRADIAAAIAIRPELEAGLEALAERGQAALRKFATDSEKTQMERPDFLMNRLRNFLNLLRT